MFMRLVKINMALALIASLGITLPAIGNLTHISALSSIPSPLHSLASLPSPDELASNVRNWLLPQVSDRARVVRAVDGDTIVVRLKGEKVTVRLIGVDTPESVKRNTAVQCYSKRASHATGEKLEGKAVTLIYDVEREDKYGRTLAYVERRGRDFNAWLIRKGYARTLEIKPNVSRASKYRGLERRASRADRGVWGACKGALSWVR